MDRDPRKSGHDLYRRDSDRVVRVKPCRFYKKITFDNCSLRQRLPERPGKLQTPRSAVPDNGEGQKPASFDQEYDNTKPKQSIQTKIVKPVQQSTPGKGT
jgi:hypothetical protein